MSHATIIDESNLNIDMAYLTVEMIFEIKFYSFTSQVKIINEKSINGS